MLGAGKGGGAGSGLDGDVYGDPLGGLSGLGGGGGRGIDGVCGVGAGPGGGVCEDGYPFDETLGASADAAVAEAWRCWLVGESWERIGGRGVATYCGYVLCGLGFRGRGVEMT